MIPVSERVVQNARECLAILEDDFQLDMNGFMSSPSDDDQGIIRSRSNGEDVNICGTSFCIAGWQAFKEGYPKEYLFRVEEGLEFDYYKYSEDKLNASELYVNINVWNFFYSSDWCNDREYAKERMKFIIDNKAIPKVCDYKGEFKGFPWDSFLFKPLDKSAS